ncbi:hypothetical protein MUO71_08505, partial [Candidatus Bathyarchaeota archaeon]|nr:hypothetical protein [Candidatus Bathyarchaeota archaeon]
MESLLNKAKEMEKKYEWLQATELYKKASDLVLKEKDPLKAAELQEQNGFCFYRAALQTQTNIEFRKLLKRAIQAYEKESKILEEIMEEDSQIRIKHANALAAYVRSWLETSPLKRKELLSKWWFLENQVLSTYVCVGDLHSVGRVCNDLIEYSNYNRYWLASDYSETSKMVNEGITLAEKSIKILSKLDDNYELARAYCFASWYYSWSKSLWETEDNIVKYVQKCQDYAKKALELSHKTGDAWLISWSYISAWNAALFGNSNPALATEYSQ